MTPKARRAKALTSPTGAQKTRGGNQASECFEGDALCEDCEFIRWEELDREEFIERFGSEEDMAELWGLNPIVFEHKGSADGPR